MRDDKRSFRQNSLWHFKATYNYGISMGANRGPMAGQSEREAFVEARTILEAMEKIEQIVTREDDPDDSVEVSFLVRSELNLSRVADSQEG